MEHLTAEDKANQIRGFKASVSAPIKHPYQAHD